MKRIVGLLLGMIFLCSIMSGFTIVSAEETGGVASGGVSVSVSLKGMTKQSELMNASQMSGKVTVSSQSASALPATVIVAAFQNNKMQYFQILYTGTITSGTKVFSFSMDKLNRVDSVRAFVIDKNNLQPFCPAAEDGLEPAQVILFKFDDVRPTVKDQTVQFDKAMSYLAEQDIPASAGILGKWLEGVKENPKKYQEQITLVRNWILAGHQLWIHGYDHAQGEFAAYGEIPASSYEKQKEIIQTTYDLMETVLHYHAACFSASYNQNNEDTISALNQAFPQMKTVMFINDPNRRLEAMNLTNSCTMESGTGKASYEAFLTRYEFVKDQPYLVLQAHPGYWDDQSLQALASIVSYLKKQNCVFMTPEQYRNFALSRR